MCGDRKTERGLCGDRKTERGLCGDRKTERGLRGDRKTERGLRGDRKAEKRGIARGLGLSGLRAVLRLATVSEHAVSVIPKSLDNRRRLCYNDENY